MKGLLIQTILAADNSEGDDTVWMQMLVLVMLVASWGIYSLIKTRAKKLKDQQQDHAEDTGSPGTQRRWRWQIQPTRKDIARHKAVTQRPVTKIQEIRLHSRKPLEEVKLPSLAPATEVHVDEHKEFIGKPLKELKDKSTRERGKDLHSGMELLELDFLLSVVENTKGDDEEDVAMRKLNFNELLRREQLNEAGSSALKVYARNEGNLYGKDIQCEAMKELTVRTSHKSKHRGTRQ
ncbi:MAG: hypothetical protein ACYS6W_03835 [Planctomycetota bacterium]|jgi:hypothetical protein